VSDRAQRDCKSEWLMKALMVSIFIGLVAAAVAWVVVKQRALEREVAGLQRENQRLAEQIANRPIVSPEALASAELALQASQVALAATEQRLTDAMLRTAALEAPGFQQTSTLDMKRRQQSTADVQGFSPDFASQIQRPPASSHALDGQLLQRDWGPEQVVGPANTDRNGDIPTAWASRRPDGGEEWLHVNYDQIVDISEVRVRETYNPGAISKIAAVLPSGEEVTIWEGTEPPTEAPVDTAFRPMSRIQASSVKIYMDTRRVRGWNEIDAVQLIGSDGSSQWASSATASSTYAER
jgi:hypothetical protein